MVSSKLISYFLALLLPFFAGAAAAATCSSVFLSNSALYQVAQATNVEKAENLVQKILWNRYLAPWSQNKQYSQSAYDKKIKESLFFLTLLKFQVPEHRWSLFSSQQKHKISSWAEEALLKKGLSGFLRARPASPSFWQKFTFKVEALLKAPLVQNLASIVTLSLPEIKPKEIPPELLENVLQDGIEGHFDELSRAFEFTHQNKVEQYKMIRNVFGGVVLGVTLVASVHTFDQEMKNLKSKQQDEAAAQFEQFSDSIDNIDALLNEIDVPQ